MVPTSIQNSPGRKWREYTIDLSSADLWPPSTTKGAGQMTCPPVTHVVTRLLHYSVAGPPLELILA